MTDTIDKLVKMLAEERQARKDAESSRNTAEMALAMQRGKEPAGLSHEFVAHKIVSALSVVGSKIEMIKLHRGLCGSGLKEAKEAIEAAIAMAK